MTRWREAIVRAAVGMVALALAGGCAARPTRLLSGTTTGPATSPELSSLAALQPALALPLPADANAKPPSLDAVQEYARGRDALLNSQKQAAIEYLTAATEAAPQSAVVWRDLGYAQLGTDDTKATVAFRQAVKFDPRDADSRLQLARLLLAARQNDDAITQLRLARLCPEFDDNDGLAAVVDLLLGQALEEAHYRRAAVECYENVLTILDERSFDLRGRPELADVFARPGVLVLRTADLATQTGDYRKAIALYQRLRRQEPQAAAMLDLRLARAELAGADVADGTRLAVGVVHGAGGSALSLALFDELYSGVGGPAAALQAIDAYDSDSPDDTHWLLRSHLLLQTGDAAGAAAAIDHVHTATVATVRQTVHAYLAANRRDDLMRRLLAMPGAWDALSRGWAI